MEARSTSPASPFAAILDWSQMWPDWQRDALRRIVSTGLLTPNDLTELGHMCRGKNGLKPSKSVHVPTAKPLSAADIPGGTGGTLAVSLKRLSDLRNVGRIPSNQEIDFGASPGLTVIYGDNGAGKSGYARVIKKACRARGPAHEIRPDAFAPPPGAPAAARIDCCVGSVNTPVDWKDGSPSDPRLSNIFVFDHYSARAHVNEDGPASFKPQGLDVLPELARACREIGDLIEREANSVSTQVALLQQTWTFKPTTLAGEFVATLAASTTPKAVEAAATFSDSDAQRLTEILSTLGADPKIKAADTTAAASRIREFCRRISTLEAGLSDEMMLRANDAIDGANSSAEAAKLAQGPALDPGDLVGTFNGVWRQLWDAAKEFSVLDAYKGKEHPCVEPGARCVLCQQTLSAEAVARYKRFDAFIRENTRAQAEAARMRLSALGVSVDALVESIPDVTAIKADLDREAAGTFDSVEAHVAALKARLGHLRACIKNTTWSDLAKLRNSSSAVLTELAVRLETRAKAELAAADPVRAKLLATEREELQDKKLLTEKKAEVLAQIDRLRLIAKLHASLADCRTNTITIKSGELEEAYVTSAFRDAFKAELQELGMTTLPVRLNEGKPTPGQRRHGVRLQGMATKANGDPLYKVEEIASEGEHRCIALAAFLAELSQASQYSAVVLDDPVSSLDRRHSALVAKRLVKEAAKRQVIVFTHDVVFLFELFDAIAAAPTTTVYWNIAWNDGIPGHTQKGLPWDVQSYAHRIDALEKEQRRLAQTWNPVPNDSNVKEMRAAYSDLSATLERVVQDVLLASVIGRYRGYVRVDNLDKVAGLSAPECAEMIRLYRRTSDVTSRHDPAAAKAAPVPDSAQFLTDLQALNTLIDQVKARRKGPSVAIAAPTTQLTTSASGAASPPLHNN